MKKVFSTAEVARAIGVDKSTLLRWLYTGKLPEPKRQTLGGVESRVWSENDVERARIYRELKGRKRS
jgi:DNA-binding transcriptional MerR regulator